MQSTMHVIPYVFQPDKILRILSFQVRAYPDIFHFRPPPFFALHIKNDKPYDHQRKQRHYYIHHMGDFCYQSAHPILPLHAFLSFPSVYPAKYQFRISGRNHPYPAPPLQATWPPNQGGTGYIPLHRYIGHACV